MMNQSDFMVFVLMIEKQLDHPSALDMFEQIIDASKGKQIVMFLDYDGTLSPIVEDPDRAFMSDAVCFPFLTPQFSSSSSFLYSAKCLIHYLSFLVSHKTNR